MFPQTVVRFTQHEVSSFFCLYFACFELEKGEREKKTFILELSNEEKKKTTISIKDASTPPPCFSTLVLTTRRRRRLRRVALTQLRTH